MRLTKKSPRTGALLFLPFVLAFGCGTPPQTASPTPPTLGPFPPAKEEQFVGVTLVGTEVTPNIAHLQIWRSKGHVAHWVFCGGEGKLQIHPKGDSPFDGEFDRADNHVRSQKVKVGTGVHTATPYQYWIEVTTPTGTYKSTDPDIEIMD